MALLLEISTLGSCLLGHQGQKKKKKKIQIPNGVPNKGRLFRIVLINRDLSMKENKKSPLRSQQSDSFFSFVKKANEGA